MTEYFWVSMKDSSMTRMAMLTSSSITYSRKWSLACASAIRIILSMWRTVIGMLPVAYAAMKARHKLQSNETLDSTLTIAVTEIEDEFRKLTIDSLRRSLYIRAILSWSIWCNFGWIFSRAYVIYFRRRSWGILSTPARFVSLMSTGALSSWMERNRVKNFWWKNLNRRSNILDDLTHFHLGGAEYASWRRSEQDIHPGRHQQCHVQRRGYRNVIK